MSYTSQQVYSIIEQTAQNDGVNPLLALGTAQQESGFNPYATGDQGTSLGLYQLHRGGLLGNLTPTQAFNPQTNATVAIANIAGIQKAYPWVTDPGQIAALAQRPSNPAAYAQAVDANMAKIQKQGLPSGKVFSPSGTTSGSATSTAAGSGFNPLDPLTYGNLWGYVERGVVMLLGVGLILLGVWMLFSGKSAGEVVEGATEKVGKAGAEAAVAA